ncbi:MAG TPA: alpha/beta hydrolase [Gemmatimonadales bacterium]|nr:alpha/beta hydrolase [Gemmatimonadales bacterium]
MALRRAPAAGRARGTLVLLHGFGDHSGRYAEPAAWFAERGLAVYALDQRGHGRSPGKRGHVSRFAQFLSDVAALRKLAAQEQAGPQLLLGHSFGGAVALRYLETEPEGLAGAIVSSPFLDVAMPVPAWKRLVASALVEVLPSLPVATGLDLAHLSTDPAVGQAAKSDPLYHRVMTPRAWREIRAAQAAVRAEGRHIRVPLLLLLAGDDRLVSRPASEAFARSLAGDVTVKTYEGFYHEIFNEPHRARVFRDVEPWLDRVLSAAAPVRAGPSPAAP